MKRLFVLLATLAIAWSSPAFAVYYDMQRTEGNAGFKATIYETLTTSDYLRAPARTFQRISVVIGDTFAFTVYQCATAEYSASTCDAGTAVSASTTSLEIETGRPWLIFDVTTAETDPAISYINIHSNPQNAGGGGGGADGVTDAGNAIVVDASHGFIVPGNAGDADDVCETNEVCLQNGVVTAEGVVVRDQASGNNVEELNDNPTTLPSAPSGANVRYYTAADGEIYKRDASDDSDLELLTTDNIIKAMRKRPTYWTDFLGTVAASGGDNLEPHVSPWNFNGFGGTAGTIAVVASPSTHHPGVISISSSVAANSGGTFRADTTSRILGGGEIFEITFQHKVASGTDTQLLFGFIDTTTIGAFVDGFGINVAEDGLSAVCLSRNASSDVDSATIGTLTVDTWYTARITVDDTDDDDIPEEGTCTITTDDGTVLGTQTIDVTSVNTTGSGIVASDSNADTTGNVIVWIDWMAMGYDSSRSLTR